MKKFIFGFISALAIVLLIDAFDPRWLPDRPLPMLLGDAESCPFCHLEKQIIYENELSKVLLNYAPIVEGQVLILPKRHVERFEELTPEEYASLGQAVQAMSRVFKSDYVLVVQNGYYGGQTVNHTHIHMIPRGTDSTLMKKIYLWKVFLAESLHRREKLTDEEQEKQVDAMKKVLHEQ